jgi:hypothetical protein
MNSHSLARGRHSHNFDSHQRPTLFTFLTQLSRRSARKRSRKYLFFFNLFGFHFVIPLFLRFGTSLCYLRYFFCGLFFDGKKI